MAKSSRPFGSKPHKCTVLLSRAHDPSYSAVAAKVIVKTPPAAPAAESASATAPKTAASMPAKKPTKASLKGVIVKKRSKPAPEAKAPPDNAKAEKAGHDDRPSPDPKRRKVALES